MFIILKSFIAGFNLYQPRKKVCFNYSELQFFRVQAAKSEKLKN